MEWPNIRTPASKEEPCNVLQDSRRTIPEVQYVQSVHFTRELALMMEKILLKIPEQMSSSFC